MKPYERKQLLERVDREGATVGTEIPEEISVDGESLALREFVFEITRRERVPPEDRERVETARTRLRRARRRRRERIEDGEITREEGETLATEIVGIDRALNALADLEETDLEAAAAAQERADRKRWLHFLRKATGRDRDDARRRGD